MVALLNLSFEALRNYLQDLGVKPFRSAQIWNWLYQRGATSFEAMRNLPAPLKAELAEHFSLSRPTVVLDQLSCDGTRKWLLRLADGNEIETVYIPEEDRGTLCISSQVGCLMACRFCHTGTQVWVRNLTPDEIIGQVLIARDCLNEWTSEKRQISNIVMMGMGEPLYNYDNVAQALEIIMDHRGLSISRRKITLSTSGVVPMIGVCGQDLGVNLAISLHAVTDDIRSQIMPINKKYPIAELMQACRNYPGLKNARRITFEYIMLKGINDSLADAKGLVRLIRGIPAKINLIPFNAWPGSPFECSSPETIAAFADVMLRAGYATPIRTPRGQDILAACGQLKSESERIRKNIPETTNSVEFLPPTD